MREKNKGESLKDHSDFEKKDDLMWREEDYTAIQKLTGFDEESIAEDQKRGLNILVFSIVCAICLIIGIVIGYNVQPRSESKRYSDSEKVLQALPQAFYTKMNTSNELYLYELNNVGEEVYLLDLSNASYKYDFIDNYLYLLFEKNGTLRFYRYEFTKQGYRRDLVKEFDSDYNEFYFENGFIALGTKNGVALYDLGGLNIKTFDVQNVNILAYNENYLVYSSKNKLYVLDSSTETTKVITSNMNSFLTFDNDTVFFTEGSKMYEVSTSDYEKKEIAEFKENNVFLKVNNYYVYNDGKTLYLLDGEVKKIKEFDSSISELLYIDCNNLVIVLDSYDAYKCSLQSDNYYLLNINSKSILERKIEGCLNYKIINDYVKIG